MVDRNESYDNVFKFQQTLISLRDTGSADGDQVRVTLNGEEVLDRVLTSSNTTEIINLAPGANTLTVTAVNEGDSSPNTIGFSFESEDVIFGEASFEVDLAAGQSVTRIIGLPKVVIDGTRTPHSSRHILDALDAQAASSEPNFDSILTIQRAGNEGRRIQNRNKYLADNGLAPGLFQIDEFPFARSADGADAIASTRAIPSSDNESSGRTFGATITSYGGVRIEDGWQVDVEATTPDFNSPNNISTPGLPDLIPIFGTEGNNTLIGTQTDDNLMYGFGGDDALFSNGGINQGNVTFSSNILLGGAGQDLLISNNGNDVLLGEGGNDDLVGGNGDDILYGGPGTDSLNSGSGEDIYVLRREEGPDIITLFRLEEDLFALVDGLKISDLSFQEIEGGAVDNEPVDFPDFPGVTDSIIFGLIISDQSSGEILAYAGTQGAPELIIGNPSGYIIEQPGGSATSLRDIVAG
ncbi:MAG: calcium-binding protein [Leptolyngbyaceae cyanobacterium]